MTQHQRYRYYSALQSKKAAVFRFGVLEALTDEQLRLAARALNLSVEEVTAADWTPPSIVMRHREPTTGPYVHATTPARTRDTPVGETWDPPAIAVRPR